MVAEKKNTPQSGAHLYYAKEWISIQSCGVFPLAKLRNEAEFSLESGLRQLSGTKTAEKSSTVRSWSENGATKLTLTVHLLDKIF